MNSDAYQQLLGRAHAVRLMARQVDVDAEIDQALAAIAHADSVGAILDPTLYRDRHEAMAQDEATLRAVRALARLGNDLAGEGIASEPRASDRSGNGSPLRTDAPSPAEQPRLPGVAS